MVLDKFRNTPDEKLCRELFLRLVQPGEGTEDTKRLVRWEELQDADPSQAEALEHVVWTLADERLITTGMAELYGEQPGRKLAAGATVEVIHEALIRDWNELRKWLDADRESFRTHHKLTAAANEWVKRDTNRSKPDSSLLYTGSRLAAARELVERGTVKLNADETAFIDASIQEIRAKKRRAEFKRGLESLASADPAELPKIIEKLARYPELAATYLQPKISWKFETGEETQEEKQQQLHYRLAQVAHDQRLVQPLLEQLLNNKIAYIGPISEQLRPHAGELTEKLWGILRNDQAPAKHRLHAAAALAHSVPDLAAESWTNTDLEFVARQLVSANAEFQPQLRKNLQSISEKLLPELERVFSDPQITNGERLSAANALADFAANEIPRLSHLLSVATPEQFKVLYPIVESNHATTKVEVLGKITATLPSVELGSVARIGFGQQRANAAITLLRLGEREQAMSVFDMTDDPEALTQFIFRCREREVSAEALLDCLDMVSQAPADRYPKNSRYGLMLALGEYSLKQEIPEARREALVTQLADWYRHDPSSGVHGASGWLLHQWGRTEIAWQVDQTPVPYTDGCEWFTLAISVPAGKSQDSSPQTFYYTFIVFPGGDYEIGSPHDEPDRGRNEPRHKVKLTQPFAILDREITMAELTAFKTEYLQYMSQVDAKPADAGFAVDWYDSVHFCRWLSLQSGFTEADQSYADPADLDKNGEGNPKNWPLVLGKRGFRLPTETEWEVASRAGARTSYGFGSDTSLLGQFGWFLENSGKHVHPPRELRPSLRGVFDQHGNVYEWTHDWFADYELGEAVDPQNVLSGSSRVVRGGSWVNDAAFCRMAYRDADAPSNRSSGDGFRVALSPS